MINRHLAVLLSSAFLALAGCASVEQSPSQASSSSQNANSGQVNIPILSKSDNGVRLQTTSGSGFQRSMYAMVEPLEEKERRYLANAIFFVAQYDNCLKTGNLTAARGKDEYKDRYRNLSPEGCYKYRERINQAKFSRVDSYGKFGRPDSNKRIHYQKLSGMVRDQGWTDAESWNRYASYVGNGGNGLTRTEIMTKYHTVLGKNAEWKDSSGLTGLGKLLSKALQ